MYRRLKAEVLQLRERKIFKILEKLDVLRNEIVILFSNLVSADAQSGSMNLHSSSSDW